MRTITSLLIILFAVFQSAAANDFEVRTIEGANGPEKVLIIMPDHTVPGTDYPVLIAPGDADPKKAMFFWGNAPSKLGWVIVQSKRVYRGNAAQMQAVLNAVKAGLAQDGFGVEGFHMIGWSANSGRASAQVASLPGRFKSLSLIPGYARGNTVTSLCKQESLRYTFITGSRDGGWLSGAEGMRDGLVKCGASNIQFEIIKGGGHVLEEISGAPLFTLLEKNRY